MAHLVSLTKTYAAVSDEIMNLFSDNSIFRLTGADDIQSDFRAGGLFRLTFRNRGVISGHFAGIKG